LIHNLFSIAVPSFLGVKDFQFRQGRSDRETGAYIGGAVREDFEGVRTHYKLERFYSQARSSVEERYIDIVEVVSSILSAPTSFNSKRSTFYDVMNFTYNQINLITLQTGRTFYWMASPSARIGFVSNFLNFKTSASL
jgi:hypothetical protein